MNVPAKRKTIGRAVKRLVYDKHSGTCAVCGQKTTMNLKDCSFGGRKAPAHIDHIIPVSKGGGNSENNLQLLCHRCNCAKRDNQHFDLSKAKEYKGRDYITIRSSFFKENEIRRLRALYGANAVICFVNVLLFCAASQRDGCFAKEDDEIFDMISSWEGDKPFFYVLQECGLMDEELSLKDKPYFKVY